MPALREALLGAVPALGLIMVADPVVAWMRTSALFVVSYVFGR